MKKLHVVFKDGAGFTLPFSIDSASLGNPWLVLLGDTGKPAGIVRLDEILLVYEVPENVN